MQCLCFVLKTLNSIFCNTYVKLVLHEILFNVFQPWNKKMGIGFKGLEYCIKHKFKGLGVYNVGVIYIFCTLNLRLISCNGY